MYLLNYVSFTYHADNLQTISVNIILITDFKKTKKKTYILMWVQSFQKFETP